MKKLIAIIAIAATGLLAFPQEAEAGHAQVKITYQSGHSACGCPIYTQRYLSGYDCYRRPIYRYAYVPVAHRCRSHVRPPVHGPHIYYYRNSGSCRPAPRAVPPRGHQRGYQRGRQQGHRGRGR